jgi:hypothetical protein
VFGFKHLDLKTSGLLHSLRAAKIFHAFGPCLEMRAVWGPRLRESVFASAAAGNSEAGRDQGSAKAVSAPAGSESAALGEGLWAGGRLPRLPSQCSSYCLFHCFVPADGLVRSERSPFARAAGLAST